MFRGITFEIENTNILGGTIVYPSLRFDMCCEIATELNKLLRWTIVYPRHNFVSELLKWTIVYRNAQVRNLMFCEITLEIIQLFAVDNCLP